MDRKNTPKQGETDPTVVSPEIQPIRSPEETSDANDEDVEDSADMEDDDDRAGIL